MSRFRGLLIAASRPRRRHAAHEHTIAPATTAPAREAPAPKTAPGSIRLGHRPTAHVPQEQAVVDGIDLLRKARPWPSCRRTPPGSAATCTSCATRSITCRARPTTAACPSCAGSTSGTNERHNLKEAQTDLWACLERWERRHPKLTDWAREARRPDADLLPAAAPAPHALEEHDPARARERGDRAAHARRSNLPQRAVMPAAGSSLVRRDPPNLAGGQPLHRDGPARASSKRRQ